MLNSGKKYSNSCVVRKKNSERIKKPYPPLQVQWSVPNDFRLRKKLDDTNVVIRRRKLKKK